VAAHGRKLTRMFAELIIFALNKVFEYVKMTILSRPFGSMRIPWRFRFFVQVFEALEMTVSGSAFTRPLINRTLIRHAILYHFQITIFCGRSNRPSIPVAPLTLFLLSRPLEQLEFIR
jgi:hypothetical protein